MDSETMPLSTPILRPIVWLILFGFLSACTQTSDNQSVVDAVLSTDAQKAKIQTARKRAAKAKIARKEEFQKRRKERWAARSTKTEKNKPDTKNQNKTKKTSKRPRRSRVSTSIKGTRYAYVGGKSRGMNIKAPWKCLPKRLKVVLRQVSKKFGRVIVNSTYRSHRRNRLVGGRRGSYHLRCQAVDFRVKGRTKGLTRWLANHPYVGGYNRYYSGYYHIDTGPKRTW